MIVVVLILVAAWAGGSVIAVRAVSKRIEKKNERLRRMNADGEIRRYAYAEGVKKTQPPGYAPPAQLAHPELYTMYHGRNAALWAGMMQNLGSMPLPPPPPPQMPPP